MKQLFFIVIFLIGSFCQIHAQGRPAHKRLSSQEFRTQQQAYITKSAALSEKEAADFFPVYYELQDKKKEIGDVWKQIHRSRHQDISESEAAEILDAFYNARMQSDQLEKVYYEKFKKILPAHKLLKVLRSEMRFQREMIRKCFKKAN